MNRYGCHSPCDPRDATAHEIATGADVSRTFNPSNLVYALKAGESVLTQAILEGINEATGGALEEVSTEAIAEGQDVAGLLNPSNLIASLTGDANAMTAAVGEALATDISQAGSASAAAVNQAVATAVADSTSAVNDAIISAVAEAIANGEAPAGLKPLTATQLATASVDAGTVQGSILAEAIKVNGSPLQAALAEGVVEGFAANPTLGAELGFYALYAVPDAGPGNTPSTFKRAYNYKTMERISVLDFSGVDRSGQTDSYAGIMTAIEYANPRGVPLHVPAGNYRVSNSLVIDSRNRTEQFSPKTSLVGDGSSSTRIFGEAGDFAVIKILGGEAGAGVHSHQRLQGLFLQKADLLGNLVYADNCAFFGMDDVATMAGDRAILLKDVLSSHFQRVVARFGNVGLLAEKENFSHPNALHFSSCVFGNNNLVGLVVFKGSNVTMSGGSIESNGTPGGAPEASGGMYLVDMGYEGGAAASLHGVYFENNAGDKDLWISSTLHKCSASISGCNFARIVGSRYSTNNIKFESWGATAGITAGIVGCGFTGYNDYSPSSARPSIVSTFGAGSSNKISHMGCMFKYTEELPGAGVTALD